MSSVRVAFRRRPSGRRRSGWLAPRRWLAAAAGIVLMLALVAAGAPAVAPPEVNTFVSRPDLRPPAVYVTAEGAAPGYVFLSPTTGAGATPPPRLQTGPLILDNSGNLVWFHPTGSAGDLDDAATDFRVQEYRGQPVLTWWQGDIQVPPGTGNGRYIIMNNSYRRVATVSAGNGLRGDLHEFLITDRNTALITIYHPVQTPNGPVIEGVVQEIDIETGRVLFQWNSLEHVAVSESYKPQPDGPAQPYDYFHINSVEVGRDGDLLISARHTHAVYKVDRQTGEVIWRLGGKRSDFEMGPGTVFSLQHDARRRPDGIITIFDNGNPGDQASRAIVLRLNRDTMTAELVREYPAPGGWFSMSQGNAQLLPNGHMLVGWGSQPFATEFDEDGDVVFHASFSQDMDSYRAYRSEWTGRPFYPPTVAVRDEPGDGITVYASWNGATEVARWRVLAGPAPDRLQPVETAPRDGFETAIELTTSTPYIAVQALNAGGAVLDTSAPLRAPG